jgi:hypothetical protein
VENPDSRNQLRQGFVRQEKGTKKRKENKQERSLAKPRSGGKITA